LLLLSHGFGSDTFSKAERLERREELEVLVSGEEEEVVGLDLRSCAFRLARFKALEEEELRDTIRCWSSDWKRS